MQTVGTLRSFPYGYRSQPCRSIFGFWKRPPRLRRTRAVFSGKRIRSRTARNAGSQRATVLRTHVYTHRRRPLVFHLPSRTRANTRSRRVGEASKLGQSSNLRIHRSHFFCIRRRTASLYTARLGVALLALSPFFLLMGGGYMNHPTCLLFLLIFLLFLDKTLSEPRTCRPHCI